jgi:hypothetical protein
MWKAAWMGGGCNSPTIASGVMLLHWFCWVSGFYCQTVVFDYLLSYPLWLRVIWFIFSSFYPEDDGGRFIRNPGKALPDYVISHPIFTVTAVRDSDVRLWSWRTQWTADCTRVVRLPPDVISLQRCAQTCCWIIQVIQVFNLHLK